jgi:hypothetical protein
MGVKNCAELPVNKKLTPEVSACATDPRQWRPHVFAKL